MEKKTFLAHFPFSDVRGLTGCEGVDWGNTDENMADHLSSWSLLDALAISIPDCHCPEGNIPTITGECTPCGGMERTVAKS
jgi:hypothetical protein